MKSPPKDGHYWYNQEGNLIGKDEAKELLDDFESRIVKLTQLTFMGYDILVSTIFVPVDHNPDSWGWSSVYPHLWITEVLGGPEDLNGISDHYGSVRAALIGHDEVVERAIASGCSIA